MRLIPTDFKFTKMTKIIITISVALLLLSSCKIEPQPIDYGNESCHFCSMTIVDNQHAAQIVTDKGKAYNYDSIECMMNDLKNEGPNAGAIFLVNDYQKPGELIDATRTFYLLGSEIPSPMGAFLSASKTFDAAKSMQREYQGEILTWDELKVRAESNEEGRL